MGAQPKNKITSVERGKRRHGNTPKLVKDSKTTKVPLYKRGYFDSLMKMIGGKSGVTTEVSHKAKKASKTASAGTSPMADNSKPNMAKSMTTVKKTTRTQHKGA
jgi:hypothetical protein